MLAICIFLFRSFRFCNSIASFHTDILEASNNIGMNLVCYFNSATLLTNGSFNASQDE